MLRSLAILGTFVLVMAARAAAPPTPPPTYRVASQSVDDVHVDPLRFSLAVVASSSAPGTGAFATFGAIVTGETYQVWSFDGPLTNRHSRVSLGASMLVLGGFSGHLGSASVAQLGLLEAGQQVDCWVLLDTDQFRPLPQDWLQVINDHEPIGAGGIEAEIYARVLNRVNYTSSLAFRQVARKDVTYAHVFSEPERYRGVVLRVEGRLLRVNRFDPPFESRMAGVNDLYEAWVFNDQLGANPYCVLFTEWPRGLPRELLGQPKIQRLIKVGIDGYFFKKYRYSSNDPRGSDRDAPLVMGHGLILLQPVKAEPETVGYPIKVVMAVFGTIFAGLIVGVIGITYWYRRADRKVRRRILARMPDFELPAPESAPPVAPPVRSVRPKAFPRRINLPAGYGPSSPGESHPPSKKEKPPPDEDAGD